MTAPVEYPRRELPGNRRRERRGRSIYGLLTYAVSQRIPEFGLRITLGARPGSILAGVVKHALLLVTAGGCLGMALAYAVGRTMKALLAGVTPADVATYAAAAGLALLMTLAGSLAPAVRALRVDPAAALRSDG